MKSTIKKILINLTLLIFTLIILFIFAEIAARLIIPARPVSDANLYQNSSFEQIGYEFIPGINGSIEGYKLQINGEGRRDNHYLKEMKNKNSIAFVGDSFVFGVGVKQNNTLPMLFEEDYKYKFDKDINAYNFGVPGYNLDQEIGVIKNKLNKTNVKKIIVVWVLNDAYDKLTLSSNDSNGINMSIQLKLYSYIMGNSRFLSYVKFVISPIIFSSGIKNGYVQYNQDFYSDNSSSWINFKSNLSELANYTKSKNISCYYVLYPTMSYLNDKHPYLNIYKKIENELNSTNIKVINLFDAFNGKDANILRSSIYDAHPNVAAQQIAAKYILDNM